MDAAEHLRLRAGLRARVKGCTLCPLHARCKAPVPFRGPIQGGPARPRLVVIGEAPGRQEDKDGMPFVGPSGQLVNEWLTKHVMDEFNGLKMEEVSFVNAVSCFPNRTPAASEIAACRATLHAQLAAIQPDYALVLGGIAVSSFWKNMRIGDIRGRWWELPIMEEDVFKNPRNTTPGVSSLDTFKVIPAIATWHPSAVLRGNGADDVIDDLRQLSVALFPEAYGPYETPLCFMCGKGDLENEHWLRCNFDLGEEVGSSNMKGALCICNKHWLQRFGKLDQQRAKRKKKGEDVKMEMF